MPRARTILALTVVPLAFACAAPSERPAPVSLAFGSSEAPVIPTVPPASLEPVASTPTPLAPPRSERLESVPAGPASLATLLERAQPPERVLQEVSYETTALGETHVLLGLQTYDSTKMWRPVDETWSLALDTSYEDFGDVVGLEWGFAFSKDSGERGGASAIPGGTETDDRCQVSLDFYEVSIGAHRSFLRDTDLRPFVGAGLDLIYYDAESIYYDDPATARVRKTHKRMTFGLYAHAGITYQFSEDLQIGFDLRQVFGTSQTNLFFNGDLDYQRASLFVGWGG